MPIDITPKKHIKALEILILSVSSLTILIFIVLLIYVKIFPVKYIIPAILLLIVLLGVVFFTQIKAKGTVIGKCLALMLCVILIYGSVSLYKFDKMVTTISDTHVKLDNISVIVLIDDPAQTIEDASEYIFGITNLINTEEPGNILETINHELGVDIKTKVYTDLHSQIKALYSGEVKAIIINEGFRGMINNFFEFFNDDTKIIESKYIETNNNYIKENDLALNDTVNEKDKLIVYITGIDTYGSISTTSRSDSNILAAINIKTRQIQLISTPRDYYIEIPVNGWHLDKLTHSGIYGVDVSIGALEKLYNINIDYYLRINETSFIDFVDELGGIEIESEYEFTVGDYHFNKGKNYLDGRSALIFAEERKSFAEGDIQRGKNQMVVIKAAFNKAMSPAILPKVGDIIDTVSHNFETNMSKDKITDLINMQLDKGGNWDLATFTVNGSGANKPTYSGGERKLSVIIPNQSMVDEAKTKINRVIE